MEPRSDRRVAAEAREIAKRTHVDLLEHVVHRISVAQEPVGKRAEVVVVVANERDERISVSVARQPNDLGVDLHSRTSRHHSLHGFLDDRRATILHALGGRLVEISNLSRRARS